MRMNNLQHIADELFESDRSCIPVAQLTDRYELTLEDAYAIQKINRDRAVQSGAKIIGKKIGLTSRAMQEALGVDTPDFGFLLDNRQMKDGCVLKKTLLQPRVEGELAFVLKADLPADATAQDVLAATDYLLPAIEIVDSHIADWKLRIQDTVADNASCGLFRLGETRINPNENPESIRMTLYKNGELVNTDTAAAVMGSPANAVAWLAQALAEYDEPLLAGDIILSGAITEAIAAIPGDRFTCDFGPHGSVSVQFME